jgi:zinc/manganese transport system substrate-binding protein
MRNVLTIVLVGLLLAAPLPAWALNIFACEPEWGTLAQEIAGDKANIKTATHARQDPHHIRAKPSLIAAIRKADIVICSGGGLEIGWMPILLQRAPASVQPGQVGYIAVADHVKMLGIPKILDRSHGDIHPEGNPHIHLNPHNISKAAKVLAARLQQVDNANASFYKQRAKDFSDRWSKSIVHWEKQAVPLSNMPVVVYHTSWLYLEDWLGLKRVASLEPKPGIPPTVSHLEDILDKVKQQPIKAIIRTPYEQTAPSEWLADKAGVKVLTLPYTIGGGDNVDTLEALFDRTLNLLGAEK